MTSMRYLSGHLSWCNYCAYVPPIKEGVIQLEENTKPVIRGFGAMTLVIIHTNDCPKAGTV